MKDHNLSPLGKISLVWVAIAATYCLCGTGTAAISPFFPRGAEPSLTTTTPEWTQVEPSVTGNDRGVISGPKTAPSSSATHSPSTTHTFSRTQPPTVTPSLPAELKIYFLDVGQGDSALVIGPDGTVALIDGGGSGFRSVALPRSE